MPKPILQTNSSNPTIVLPQSEPTEKTPKFIAQYFSDNPHQNFFQQLPPDLNGWISLYLQSQVNGVKKKGTVENMTRDLKLFYDFFQNHHHTNDIRQWQPTTTKRLIQHLEEELKRKPSTIKRFFATINSFAKWTHSVRPDFFPLGKPTRGAKLPTQEAMRPKGLTKKYARAFLDTAQNRIYKLAANEDLDWMKKGQQASKRPYRDLAMIKIMLNAGLRREEICALNLAQLDGRHLKDVKCKGNMYRNVLLGKETLHAVRLYLEHERAKDHPDFADSPALFLPAGAKKHRNTTGRLSVRSINVIVESISKETNGMLPSDQQTHVTPHMLRHTHAREYQAKYGDAATQRRLGHTGTAYLALYTQPTVEAEIGMVDDIEIF